MAALFYCLFINVMKNLSSLVNTWGTPQFQTCLLKALEQLEPDDLPLKQVAHFTGLFDQQSLQFSVLNTSESEQQIQVKLSVFYQEMATTCPCSGQEAEKINGHCEINMNIHKQDANVIFKILG
jgi:hypothetical protein